MLLPTAAISTVTLLGFALTAAVWMPNVIARNLNQFGFFGIALALVTWCPAHPPSLDAPVRTMRLRDAFTPTNDEQQQE